MSRSALSLLATVLLLILSASTKAATGGDEPARTNAGREREHRNAMETQRVLQACWFSNVSKMGIFVVTDTVPLSSRLTQRALVAKLKMDLQKIGIKPISRTEAILSGQPVLTVKVKVVPLQTRNTYYCRVQGIVQDTAQSTRSSAKGSVTVWQYDEDDFPHDDDASTWPLSKVDQLFADLKSVYLTANPKR